MSRKRITSKELAKLAGVSSATISRAFSPDSRIGSATRDRILAAAREHGYQPNAIALGRSTLPKEEEAPAAEEQYKPVPSIQQTPCAFRTKVSRRQSI